MHSGVVEPGLSGPALHDLLSIWDYDVIPSSPRIAAKISLNLSPILTLAGNERELSGSIVWLQAFPAERSLVLDGQLRAINCRKEWLLLC